MYDRLYSIFNWGHGKPDGGEHIVEFDKYFIRFRIKFKFKQQKNVLEPFYANERLSKKLINLIQIEQALKKILFNSSTITTRLLVARQQNAYKLSGLTRFIYKNLYCTHTKHTNLWVQPATFNITHRYHFMYRIIPFKCSTLS